MNPTTAPLTRKKLLAATSVVGLFLAIMTIRLASAEPVDSTVPTTCSLGGGTVDVDIPLNVDDQPDPVEEGKQLTLLTKIGKPNIQVEVTLDKIVVTQPIPAEAASIDSVTFSGGNMAGSYEVQGSNLMITFTGPQQSSQAEMPVVTMVLTVKTGIAPTKIAWKVFSQFVADTNYGTATCTPKDPNADVNTTDVVQAGAGSTTTAGPSTTAGPTTTTAPGSSTTSTTAPESTTSTTAPASTTTTTKPGSPIPGAPDLPTPPGLPSPPSGPGCSLPVPIPVPMTLPSTPLPCPSLPAPPPGPPSLPATPSIPSPSPSPSPSGPDVNVQIKVQAKATVSL